MNTSIEHILSLENADSAKNSLDNLYQKYQKHQTLQNALNISRLSPTELKSWYLSNEDDLFDNLFVTFNSLKDYIEALNKHNLLADVMPFYLNKYVKTEKNVFEIISKLFLFKDQNYQSLSDSVIDNILEQIECVDLFKNKHWQDVFAFQSISLTNIYIAVVEKYQIFTNFVIPKNNSYYLLKTNIAENNKEDLFLTIANQNIHFFANDISKELFYEYCNGKNTLQNMLINLYPKLQTYQKDIIKQDLSNIVPGHSDRHNEIYKLILEKLLYIDNKIDQYNDLQKNLPSLTETKKVCKI